jgi:chemotaxis protein CheD
MSLAQPPGAAPKHFLQPCTLFAHRQEHWVTTILGSCIAVCLWDARLGLGGINHYMLPLWNGEGLPTPKYGNIAIERLLAKLEGLGSRRGQLVAKLFGGGRVIPGDAAPFSVGDRNILLARELLTTHGIPIGAEAVGGVRGVKIHFNTRTGGVLLARLPAGDPLAAVLPDGRPRAALERLKGTP